MDDVQWHFREMARGEINQNPMEREFFVAETINERLVREAIQNSLDASYARADRTSIPGPVRVRFSLRGVRQPLSPDRAGAYLPSLLEHLAEGLDQNDDFRRQIAQPGLLGEGMQYLVVEDSGTVGLEGDWLQYDDSAQESAQDNNFYWFFRNVGRSGKSDTDGGSWGLGKWVFPDSSHASAYIAVTRRRSDGETLLMGQAVLTKHNVDSQRYAPYGYFGVLDDDNLAVPLRMSEPAHRPLIEQCIADFGLRLRDEPGLSVIIPFPRVAEDPPINKDYIAAAVVHNYFFPIITGRLEVTVDEGDGSLPTEITTDTIDDVLHHIPLEASGERSMGSYQRLFDICRDAATLPDRDYIELNSPPQKSLQYEHYDELADLRSRYDAGELLAFRVKTEVRKKDGTETSTSFRLFVQHDDSLTPGHDFYVRGALSISTMDLIKRYRARTLLIVDEEEPLAAMLRTPSLRRIRRGVPRATGSRSAGFRHRGASMMSFVRQRHFFLFGSRPRRRCSETRLRISSRQARRADGGSGAKLQGAWVVTDRGSARSVHTPISIYNETALDSASGSPREWRSHRRGCCFR